MASPNAVLHRMEPVSDSVYQPLNTEKREIRLLRLHGLRPGDDSVIKCSIQHAVLYVNPPEYSAISYMWGDPGETKTLEISGTEVAIPKNAWEVLEAMCWRQELIWIDSVCINQNHIKERNHQVALMGDIYSSAERVYVWLGRGTERSLQVMDAIRQDGPHRLRTDGIKKLSRLSAQLIERRLEAWNQDMNQPHDPNILHYPLFDIERRLDDLKELEEDIQRILLEDVNFSLDYQDSDWKRELVRRMREIWTESQQYVAELRSGLIEIYDNAYWNRLWIVQEIVLGKSVFVVQGDKAVPWERFTRLLEPETYVDRLLPWAARKTELSAVKSVVDCRNRYHETQKLNHKLDLVILLDIFRYKKCTNRRDMVYGLLSLSAHQIDINYENSLVQVHFATLETCLNSRLLITAYEAEAFSFKLQEALEVSIPLCDVRFFLNVSSPLAMVPHITNGVLWFLKNHVIASVKDAASGQTLEEGASSIGNWTWEYDFSGGRLRPFCQIPGANSRIELIVFGYAGVLDGYAGERGGDTELTWLELGDLMADFRGPPIYTQQQKPWVLPGSPRRHRGTDKKSNFPGLPY